jgi:DNA-binding MarR family transcriptional regulator
LKELEEVSDIDIKMRSLIAGVELLVNEYKVTSETLFKEKILEETDEKLEKLMHYIRLQNGITYEMHSALLRSKINILKYNPSIARQMLDSIIEEDSPVPIEIKRRIEEIEEDIENLEWSQSEFSFEKEFHSIPALKIFLYLLPRNLASFSEIQRGTSLSPGQLSSKTTKLEELGYIIKHKKFIDQKMTTLFSLTVKGFSDFKAYMEELREFIKM